jgi:polyisoprenoid-binding protein YceI
MTRWIIDSDHAQAGFMIRHMLVADVTGLFSRIEGDIFYDPPEIEKVSVCADIDVRSLTTGHRERDDHLLTPDFFDAERYPKILFRSISTERTGFSKGKVEGDLTIHGLTRRVDLDIEISGPVRNPFSGREIIGCTGKGRLDREEFGIEWTAAMPAGGLVGARDIHLNFSVEAKRAD